MKRLKASILGVIVLSIVSLAGILICQTIWMRGTVRLTSEQYDSMAMDVLKAASHEYVRIQLSQRLELGDSIGREGLSGHEEVNKPLLDSLLTLYIKGSELPSDYKYHLVCASSIDTAHSVSDNLEGCYKVSLDQAGGINGLSDYCLYLCFQSGKQCLPENMWYALIGFGVCIAVVTFCILYLAKTVTRQKRLAEEQADFTNSMIHELKTPVATIGMSSKVLKRAGISVTDFEKLRNYAEIVEAENNRIWVCVDSLLQALTVKKRVLSLKHEPVDINGIVKLAIEGFSVATVTKVEFELRLDEDLPLVNADKMHIRAIVDNIVDNAIKYSPAGSKVTVMTKRMWGNVLIMVEDNGRGIAKKDSKRMFDKFYRVSSEKKRGIKGFGLGLYYVKQVVDAHGGKVFVKSKLNKGTQMGVLLPVNN